MFLTLEKLADKLGTDLNCCLALVLNGDIPPPSILGGRLVRWSVEGLNRWAAVDCPKGRPLSRQAAYELRTTRLDEIEEQNNSWLENFASNNPEGIE